MKTSPSSFSCDEESKHEGRGRERTCSTKASGQEAGSGKPRAIWASMFMKQPLRRAAESRAD